MLRSVIDPVVSAVYPRSCGICSGKVESLIDGPACRSCWESIRKFDGTEMLCNKCGAFLSDTAAPISVFCRKCDDHHFDKAWAIGVYEGALSAAAIALKSDPHVCRTLKDLMSKAVEERREYDLVVPVPLSQLRFIERGFNQAELIARVVAETFGVAVDARSLSRKLDTPMHRVGMDDRARELTVQNAFAVVRPKLIKDKRILLVDDVLTSGSTASYCAKVLKKSGATSVDVFTIARAVMR